MPPSASKVAAILLISGLALPASAQPSSEGFAPSFVLYFTHSDDTALVSWAPGSDVADYYNVYGVLDEQAPTLLASVQFGNLTVRVPGGYSTYAVSGVRLGIESQLVYPVGDKCVRIGLDPPDAGISDCPRAGSTITSEQANIAIAVRA